MATETSTIQSDSHVVPSGQGDIGSLIDSLTFGESYGASNLVHIAGDVYIGAYTDEDSRDGFIFTVSIDTDGNVGASTIDTYEFDANAGYTPQITRIKDTNVFIVEYSGPDSDGWMCTISVADNGTITKSKIDSWEYDTVTSQGMGQVHHINGTKYMLAYSGADYDVQVISFDISDAGDIDTITGVIDTLEIGTSITSNWQPGTIQHEDTGSSVIYAIAFTDEEDDLDGWVSTVEIDYDGTNIIELTSTEFDAGRGVYCFICKAIEDGDDTVYAISYQGADEDGMLTTVKVLEDGSAISVLDSFEFDTDYCVHAHIQQVADGVVANVYMAGGGGAPGTLKTYSIATNGDIAVLDSVDFDDDHGDTMFLNYIKGSGDKWAIFYNGGAPTVDNIIKTYAIEGTDIPETSTIQSNSHIYVTESDTIQSDSHIKVTESSTIDSDSHVIYRETSTIQSDSYVAVIGTDTINSDSHIKATESDTIQSDSHITEIEVGAIQSDSHIKVTESSTIQSNSHIAEIGYITESQIVDHVFDTNICTHFSICKISGTYYAIAYRGVSGYGYLKTFNIPDDGTSVILVDSWTYESGDVSSVNITKVGDSNYYSIWGDVSGEGTVFTCVISTIGVIIKSTTDSLQYAPTGTYSWTNNVSVLHIPDTDYYLCSYRAISDVSFHIDCIDISSGSGAIGNSVVDSIDFGVSSSTDGYYSSMVYLENGMAACTYQRISSEGHLITFTVDTVTGTLSSVLDDKSTGSISNNIPFVDVDICKPHCYENIVVFVWQGPDGDGFLQTAEIDTTTGSITLLHQNEYESSYGRWPGITRISHDGAIMIGVLGSSVTYPEGEGKIFTFQTDTGGAISSLDSWEVSTYAGATYEVSRPVRWQQIGGTDSNIWACVCGETLDYHGHIFIFRVESDNTCPPPTVTESSSIASDSHTKASESSTAQSDSHIDRDDGDISEVIDDYAIPPYPQIVHLDGDYIAVASRTSTGDTGYIRTYVVDSEGQVSGSIGDWNFSVYANTPQIISIPGATDKYLLSYEPSSGSAGIVKSLTIDITGTITKSFIATLTMSARSLYGQLFHTGDDNNTCLAHLDGGKIDSFTTDTAGNISASIVDTQDYSAYSATYPCPVINLTNNYYAVVRDDDLLTFSIDGSSNITHVDHWDWTADAAAGAVIMKVPNSSKYIIAYKDNAASGSLATVSISDTGVITESIIDTLIFESGSISKTPIGLHNLDGDYFAVLARGDDEDGRVYTFTCDSDGILSDAVVDSLEFYDGTTYAMGIGAEMCHVQNDMYAAVYTLLVDDTGAITTFNIEVPTAPTESSTINSNTVISGLNSGVDSVTFTYAEPAGVTDIESNYNAFDVKLKHTCNHNLSNVQYTLNTCPRCLGTGYYYDIKFNEAGQPIMVELVDKLVQTLEKFVLTENNDFHSEVAINAQQWLGESPISEIKAAIKFELSKSLITLMETQQGVPNLATEAQIASIDSIEVFEDTDNPGSLDYAVTITTAAGNSRELTGTVVLS